MVVMRLREIVEEMNRRRPDGADRFSFYKLAKNAQVSNSTVFRLIKEATKPQPVGRIDAVVCEKLLGALNARAKEWHLDEYGIGDLLVIIKKENQSRGSSHAR